MIPAGMSHRGKWPFSLNSYMYIRISPGYFQMSYLQIIPTLDNLLMKNNQLYRSGGQAGEWTSDP